MRHRVAGRKLGRTTEHRVAMLRNMTTSLFDKEKIRTTLIKAKELRPFAERLITISKKDSLHARRRVLQQIRDKSVVAKLFDTLAPRYSERPGGYTRIIKLGPRRGDNAEMALVELVDSAPAPVERDEPKTKKATKRTTSRKAASGDDASAGTEKKAGAKKAAKKKTTKAASKKSAGKKTAAKKAAKKKTTKKSAAE